MQPTRSPGGDLPSPGTIDFYWATGPDISNKLQTPTTPVKVTTIQPAGSYTATTSIASLGPRPSNANYILAVADSTNADTAHNVVSVVAPPPFVVTTLNDLGPGSLRDVITRVDSDPIANGGSSHHVRFQHPGRHDSTPLPASVLTCAAK